MIELLLKQGVKFYPYLYFKLKADAYVCLLNEVGTEGVVTFFRCHCLKSVLSCTQACSAGAMPSAQQRPRINSNAAASEANYEMLTKKSCTSAMLSI